MILPCEVGQLFRHQLGIEKSALDRRLVLHESRDNLVDVLLANALRLLALRRDKALDLDLEQAAFLVETNIARVRIVAAFAIVKAGVASLLAFLGLNSKRGREPAP